MIELLLNIRGANRKKLVDFFSLELIQSITSMVGWYVNFSQRNKAQKVLKQ